MRSLTGYSTNPSKESVENEGGVKAQHCADGSVERNSVVMVGKWCFMAVCCVGYCYAGGGGISICLSTSTVQYCNLSKS